MLSSVLPEVQAQVNNHMWPLKLLEAAGLQAVPTGRFASQPLALLSSVPEEDQATTASKALPCRGGNLHSAAPRPKTAVPLSRSLPGPASSKSTGPMCTRRHGFRGCASENSAQAHSSLPWAPDRRGRTCFAQVYAPCRQSPSPRDVPRCWLLAS